MRDDYLKCINNYDVEGLAKLFFMSSSIQLANWVSMKKNQPRLHRRDIELDNSDIFCRAGRFSKSITPTT